MNARRLPVVARRLPVVALLGLLAVSGLVACRADPAVAAYVGEVRVTEAEVDGVIADLREEAGGSIEQELAQAAGELDEADLAAQEEQRYGELEQQLAAIRTRVVEMRVLTEVGTRYAEQEGLAVPAPDREPIASQLGLPADSRYVDVLARFVAVMDALQGSVEPVAPTETDQREVYDNLVAEGLAVPFAQVRTELDEQVLGQPVAMRDLLTEAVDRAEVQLNPRYDLVYRVPVALGNTQSWLDVPLGDSAVVEAG